MPTDKVQQLYSNMADQHSMEVLFQQAQAQLQVTQTQVLVLI